MWLNLLHLPVIFSVLADFEFVLIIQIPQDLGSLTRHHLLEATPITG